METTNKVSATLNADEMLAQMLNMGLNNSISVVDNYTEEDIQSYFEDMLYNEYVRLLKRDAELKVAQAKGEDYQFGDKKRKVYNSDFTFKIDTRTNSMVRDVDNAQPHSKYAIVFAIRDRSSQDDLVRAKRMFDYVVDNSVDGVLGSDIQLHQFRKDEHSEPTTQSNPYVYFKCNKDAFKGKYIKLKEIVNNHGKKQLFINLEPSYLPTSPEVEFLDHATRSESIQNRRNYIKQTNDLYAKRGVSAGADEVLA